MWRAGDGPCPTGALTPKLAENALEQLLEEARLAEPEPSNDGPTFGIAVRDWLVYLQIEHRRKASSLETARSVGRRLIRRFGGATQLRAIRPEEIDAFRRDLLASELAVRTAQNIMVLLNAVFRLARRRNLIDSNPCDNIERIPLVDTETFNVLQPVEFERVYRAVLTKLDERPRSKRTPDEIDKLTVVEREGYHEEAQTGPGTLLTRDARTSATRPTARVGRTHARHRHAAACYR